ncbi:MAG TPA: PKD domain-containing protein [Gemmataceae bacterium]|nr:PKD domain-containing protein [Gemmataceae bacterium]
MAEEKKTKEETKKVGWIKGLVGAAMGLLSGAAAMYISPLVDSVVKPPKPLANFAVETDGLTATFHNRFAGEGWWDFGDGSPLEPAEPQQASIAHLYAKPGTYTVKLIVRNFIGDENERTVPLQVTVDNSNVAVPKITSLQAVAAGPRSAPATFRLVAEAANAERCVWDLGENKPLAVVTDGAAKQEQLVTFVTPGEHLVQMLALNGEYAVRQTVKIQVDPPMPGTLVAHVYLADRSSHVHKRQTTQTIPISLPRQAGTTLPIDRKLDAHSGYLITEAKLGATDPAFRNLKVTLAADHRSLQLTGELVVSKQLMQSPNPPMVPVIVSQEKQINSQTAPVELATAIAPGGSAILPLPPLPAGSPPGQRQIMLEILDGTTPIWREMLPAKNSGLYWKNQRWAIAAEPGAAQLRISIVPPGGVVPASAN